MKLSAPGFVAVLACKFVCIAACTAVLLAKDHTTGRKGPRWVDLSMASTGVASLACALAVICFQVYRGRTGSASKAGVVLAAAGTAAHTAMLAALSLYWSCFYHKAYYRNSALGDGRPRIVQRQVNYFAYYGRWSDEEAALYALGCLAGVMAWLMALAASAADVHLATKQLAATKMPLAASAPQAASLSVPVVPDQVVPSTPCSLSPYSSAVSTPRGASPLPEADALLMPSKVAAVLAAADALPLPGTPASSDTRAQLA